MGEGSGGKRMRARAPGVLLLPGDAPAAQSAPHRHELAALAQDRGPETPMQPVEGGIRAESEWPEAGKGRADKAVPAPGNETARTEDAGGVESGGA